MLGNAPDDILDDSSTVLLRFLQVDVIAKVLLPLHILGSSILVDGMRRGAGQSGESLAMSSSSVSSVRASSNKRALFDFFGGLTHVPLTGVISPRAGDARSSCVRNCWEKELNWARSVSWFSFLSDAALVNGQYLIWELRST
jgi:hypothetical protein